MNMNLKQNYKCVYIHVHIKMHFTTKHVNWQHSNIKISMLNKEINVKQWINMHRLIKKERNKLIIIQTHKINTDKRKETKFLKKKGEKKIQFLFWMCTIYICCVFMDLCIVRFLFCLPTCAFVWLQVQGPSIAGVPSKAHCGSVSISAPIVTS